MSEVKQFRHSQIAEVGKVLRKGDFNYHYRSVTMADGAVGLYFGDEGAGPEDPSLLVLDVLMQTGETVPYFVRPNKAGNGYVMWIQLTKDEATQRIARAKAAGDKIEPPTQQKIDPPAQQKIDPPAQQKVESPGWIAPPPAQQNEGIPGERIKPPKMEDISFPNTPPPETTKAGGGKEPLDDPFYGYGSRNAMFDAKDHYFRWLEKYKMLRDEMADKEFSFRYFLTTALDIVKDTGKGLQPSQLKDIAWELAIEMYNNYRALKFSESGQIVNDGPTKAGK